MMAAVVDHIRFGTVIRAAAHAVVSSSGLHTPDLKAQRAPLQWLQQM